MNVLEVESMKRNPWMLGIMSVLLCVMVIALRPTHAEAASQSDRNAYSAVFDATYYYNTYPDVAAAYGRNDAALFNHFVTFGINEGRSASAEYNPQAYIARYADLQAAFGGDVAAYCRHYVAYGRSEGRNASADGQAYAPVVRRYNTGTQTSQTEDIKVVSEQESPSVSRQETSVTVASAAGALGTYTTYYETGVSRASNVELAASRINGVVVQPGSSFSFSNTILPRTRANGYVEGPIFVKGGTAIGIGGGVCQVSSTLYAAMITAGLPATERHPHSRPVDYLPQGMDATISGNYMDLKFTNIYDRPLLILASASGGTLTVTLVLQ